VDALVAIGARRHRALRGPSGALRQAPTASEGARSERDHGADHLGAHPSRTAADRGRAASMRAGLAHLGARDMYPSERVDFMRWEEAQDG